MASSKDPTQAPMVLGSLAGDCSLPCRAAAVSCPAAVASGLGWGLGSVACGYDPPSSAIALLADASLRVGDPNGEHAHLAGAQAIDCVPVGVRQMSCLAIGMPPCLLWPGRHGVSRTPP